MDSDLRRSFSRESRRFWCMVKNNRFLYFWFSILNRFSWFMRFSKCRFFLQRDRLADSRFDCIRLSFLSCMDRTSRFEPCEPDPNPGLAGSLTRENSSSISLGVNMVSRTGKYEEWTASASSWKNIVVVATRKLKRKLNRNVFQKMNRRVERRGKGKNVSVGDGYLRCEKSCKTQHVGPTTTKEIGKLYAHLSKEKKK